MKKVKNISAQEWLPINYIYSNGIIKINKNKYIKILKIIPINYNLKSDLDYLFSEAIWLIGLAESFNYKMESKQFLEHKYKDYTSIKEGYKKLMALNYNIKEHRLYTEEEMKVNRDKSNKIAMDILKNISF